MGTGKIFGFFFLILFCFVFNKIKKRHYVLLICDVSLVQKLETRLHRWDRHLQGTRASPGLFSQQEPAKPRTQQTY